MGNEVYGASPASKTVVDTERRTGLFAPPRRSGSETYGGASHSPPVGSSPPPSPDSVPAAVVDGALASASGEPSSPHALTTRVHARHATNSRPILLESPIRICPLLVGIRP